MFSFSFQPTLDALPQTLGRRFTLKHNGYQLAFCSVRKTRGDESRLYVMHIAIFLGCELKQLNKKMAEMYVRACYAAFPRLVCFDK